MTMIAENAVYEMDALELLRGLDDASVDLICTDPPYATLDIAWDRRIDWHALWPEMARVVTQRGAIVMTAQNPFAAELIVGNRKMFRYEWVWEKTMAMGFVNAACQPMRAHELVLVFSHSLHVNGAHKERLMNYYPLMTKGTPYSRHRKAESLAHYNDVTRGTGANVSGDRLPRSVLRIANPNHNSPHPTAKPLALMEYLIRTYTRVGDLVLDPFAGSGTTLVAAKRLDRRYIGGDTDAGYCDVARGRLDEPYTYQLFAEEGAS
jgi:site-specific DNA-methyltransferase (adenine-specific)